MCGGSNIHRFDAMAEAELENEVLVSGAIQAFKDYLILSLEMDQSEVENLFSSHSSAEKETKELNKQKTQAVENEDYAIADSLKKKINALKS